MAAVLRRRTSSSAAAASSSSCLESGISALGLLELCGFAGGSLLVLASGPRLLVLVGASLEPTCGVLRRLLMLSNLKYLSCGLRCK